MCRAGEARFLVRPEGWARGAGEWVSVKFGGSPACWVARDPSGPQEQAETRRWGPEEIEGRAGARGGVGDGPPHSLSAKGRRAPVGGGGVAGAERGRGSGSVCWARLLAAWPESLGLGAWALGLWVRCPLLRGKKGSQGQGDAPGEVCHPCWDIPLRSESWGDCSPASPVGRQLPQTCP